MKTQINEELFEKMATPQFLRIVTEDTYRTIISSLNVSVLNVKKATPKEMLETAKFLQDQATNIELMAKKLQEKEATIEKK